MMMHTGEEPFAFFMTKKFLDKMMALGVPVRGWEVRQYYEDTITVNFECLVDDSSGLLVPLEVCGGPDASSG